MLHEDQKMGQRIEHSPCLPSKSCRLRGPLLLMQGLLPAEVV